MHSLSAGPAAGARRRLASYATRLMLAVSFLTIIPAGPRTPASEDDLAASFGLFPLVGFMIGATLMAADWMLAFLFGAAIRSGLVLLALIIMTGALHLDALADTADALAAGGNRSRALEILRDSSVGVFGAVAVLFWLGLEWTALAQLEGRARCIALYVAPGAGRWAMVAVAAGLDYLRPAGAGSFLKPQWSWPNLRIASAIVAIAIIPVFSAQARTAAAFAILAALAARWFYRRWLGGVTGDLIGAAGAVAELTAMLAMAARLR
jgi:adenosylcobinamide-GDP ribazoletransferase